MNKMVHRSDIARLNQAFQRALIEENDYDMEFRIQTAQGDTRFIRCEGRCARDVTGEVTALYGIMQDMTERMAVEHELREAKDTAERAYAARTQFLANMSHELRTPLNAIIGFSEMMQHQLLGPLGNDKYLEYIGGIRESGEHLLDLISDILDMSKIEAGKYELDLSEIQPGKLIKLATHMMEGRAHEAKVKIHIDDQINETLKIIADRRATLQIILNLLSNAVKFTKEGGLIAISLQEQEKFCLIKVSDNGIGIPANKLATITRPFEQVSSSYARAHQGSGLGLAITKELVEMHGGGITIESKLGQGTTVTIRLPHRAKN
jgi:signal transduction histidine kinase